MQEFFRLQTDAAVSRIIHPVSIIVTLWKYSGMLKKGQRFLQVTDAMYWSAIKFLSLTWMHSSTVFYQGSFNNKNRNNNNNNNNNNNLVLIMHIYVQGQRTAR